MMRFRIGKRCRGCGDLFGAVDLRPNPRLSPEQQSLLMDYCAECACELALGQVFPTRAKLDSSGHGCPLEPNNDAGPFQENAIREMEGGR